MFQNNTHLHEELDHIHVPVDDGYVQRSLALIRTRGVLKGATLLQ
jgi:hypothetical protein